jgi:ribosomal protein L37AE/L43A
MTYSCTECGDWVHSKRWALGYHTCRACGEAKARAARTSWTVAPVHKSNYILVTNREELKFINNKGPS